ncbi:MAG: L,D-transpeptidase [Verrucomicrobiota bacterium]
MSVPIHTKDFSLLIDKCIALSTTPTPVSLTVSISKQTLDLYREGALRRTFTISTSRNPPSCVENSEGTPIGLHEISDAIGDGEPRGTVFKGRVSVGKRFWEMPEDEQFGNLITTRILWLRGLESGVNQGRGVDSHDRYIYIHGTNHENRLGHPASAGCILLSNPDMEELFESVDIGSLVLICE